MRSIDMGREPDLVLAGLSVWALGREFEQAEDYWDGNWLRVHVRVEAPGTRVEFSGPWLRNDEIRSFATQLEQVHSDLKGSATLDCIEPIIGATVICGSRGQIAVTIEATPDHLSQRHHFEFSIDQSYLVQTLAGCRRLLERFPIKGSPTDG